MKSKLIGFLQCKPLIIALELNGMNEDNNGKWVDKSAQRLNWKINGWQIGMENEKWRKKLFPTAGFRFHENLESNKKKYLSNDWVESDLFEEFLNRNCSHCYLTMFFGTTRNGGGIVNCVCVVKTNFGQKGTTFPPPLPYFRQILNTIIITMR